MRAPAASTSPAAPTCDTTSTAHHRLVACLGALGLALGLVLTSLATRERALWLTPLPASAQSQEATSEPLYLPLIAGTQVLPIHVRSLLITDADAVARHFELESDDPELLRWRSSLEALASQASVEGVLIDDLLHQTDPQVARAYAAWGANHDPTATNRLANRFAEALRAWIWRQKATRWPALEYLVLVGDDRILPFYRLRIDPPQDDREGWATEPDYFEWGKVGAGSTVGAALAADLSLNDDFYAAPDMQAWGDGTEALPLPRLAIGRLVEWPADMTAVVDSYLDQPRLEVSRALLAGYDFMQDALEAIEPDLAARLPTTARTQLIGSSWQEQALRNALFEQRHELIFLALHASHFRVETPGNGAIFSEDLVHQPTDLRGSLVVALACHAGLNAGGEDHGRPLDFPEVLLSQGASLVASPGWAFGGDRKQPGLRYQEALMADFSDALLADGGQPIGHALERAKQVYANRVEARNAWHAKTLAGTLLYGLPMYELHIGSASRRVDRLRDRRTAHDIGVD